jgi:1-acyl-sn-glycerol-3-phosphate acyltransferase
MAYYISKFILYLWGWKIESQFPKEKVKKCVFIVAPHTSYYDFIIGRLAYYYLCVNPKFLIKKALFTFPLGPILRAFGGVPVDRSKTRNFISQVVELFNQNESFYLTITPEGTRKYNPKWQLGFYHIARTANVPVYMCYIDFKNKRGGIGPELKISGDIEKDFKIVEAFYSTMHAKHPEKFNLTPKTE